MDALQVVLLVGIVAVAFDFTLLARRRARLESRRRQQSLRAQLGLEEGP